LDEYRLKLAQSNLDQYENRWSNFGAFMSYLEDTPNTLPGAAELVNQYDGHRTVSVVVMQRQTLTTSATRVCTATSTQATSTYVTPTWTTIVTSFFLVPSEHKGNYVSYQEALNHNVAAVERAFLTAIDTAAYTSLNTNKSTVNAADGNPYTVNGNNDMVIAAADNELFFNEAASILMQNNLPSDAVNVIASPRMAALARELNAQGPANNANRAFQFGPYSFYHSPRVTVAAGDRDAAFIAPKGSLAFLSYVDQDAQMGSKSGDHEWSVQFLPKLGLNVGLLVTRDCADESSHGGGASASSLMESFQFSFDYSFVTAYDSGSGQGTPIFKAAFSKV
jgi:hypothetical protein